MKGRILVLVRSVSEVDLARALVTALPEADFLLSFALSDLRTRFGDTPHLTTHDPALAMLEAHTLGLAICFSGTRDLGPHSHFAVVAFLREVGVPTLEIQHDLQQDTVRAARDTLASTYWTWSGPEGIGNLRSLTPPPRARHVRADVIALTSQLDGETYAEEDCFRFVLAVMRLAREQPECTFIWRQSASETQPAQLGRIWDMVARLGPKNLYLEENEPSGALFARAFAVIGMAEARLLDAGTLAKPGLVFLGRGQKLAAPLSGRTFTSYAELREAFSALRADASAFALACQLPATDPQLLARRLAALAREPAAVDVGVLARYVAEVQAGRAREGAAKHASGMDKRLGQLERSATAQDEQLSKVLERLGVLQRSSVAYKALKLFGRVRKGALLR